MRTNRLLLVAATFAASAAACVGDIGDPPGGPGSGPLSCEEGISPGPSPIRRMTRFEFDGTVRDLLGDTTQPASGFGAEEEGLGFNNNAEALITTVALAEKYMLAAEDISGRATEPLSKVVPCDPAAIGEDACAYAFIDSFGKRAFRRPLTEEERAMFFEQFAFGRSQADFRLGIRMVIETALQSPPFLYRVEFGVADAEEDGAVPLTSWEMASRLSYFFWGTMPDEELFAAAEADELVTPEQIEAQARRMIADPKARDVVNEFHRQWLDYERVANITKDAAMYPDWSPAVGDLMAGETRAFIEHAVFDDAGDLRTLFTAPYSYMNGELAAFYGIGGPAGADFERVDLDPSQRAGLLTMGTLLVINSHTNQTSPVLRGKMVREQILCDVLEPPPPNVSTQAPEIEPGSTGKERFMQHMADPACSTCHKLMDPIGFGFENYDTVARYRATEGGQPVDATGEITASDVDGPFNGVVELANKLSESGEVSACYAKQWFRYGYGRGETVEDTCTVDFLNAELDRHGGNVRELLVSLALTEAFLYRRAPSAEGGEP